MRHWWGVVVFAVGITTVEGIPIIGVDELVAGDTVEFT